MYCSVAVLEGKLYAVGGLDGSTTLDIVEVYDPQVRQSERRGQGTRPMSTQADLVCPHLTAVPCFMTDQHMVGGP